MPQVLAKDVLNEAILQGLSTEFAAAKCLQCEALATFRRNIAHCSARLCTLRGFGDVEV